jgi:hypothetical protein
MEIKSKLGSLIGETIGEFVLSDQSDNFHGKWKCLQRLMQFESYIYSRTKKYLNRENKRRYYGRTKGFPIRTGRQAVIQLPPGMSLK